jgi:hypothetical protein
MTNKLLLSTLIASSFFIASQANAVDQSGTAKFELVAPIDILEDVQMEFGNVSTLKANDTCTVAFDDTVSGAACVVGGAAAATGSFTVTAKGDINLSVSTADTSIPGVSFTPNVEFATLNTGVTNTATVKVGGEVEITDIATAPTGAQTLSYTLSVVY